MTVKDLFREEALESLRQKEDLDHLLNATAPHERVFVIGIGAVLLLILGWLAFGSVTRTVAAEGILMQAGPRLVVLSDGEGYLAEYLVSPGDRIEVGQVVGRLTTPKQDARIESLSVLVESLSEEPANGLGPEELDWTLATARVILLQSEAERAAGAVFRSSVAGVVAHLPFEPGEQVVPGEVVAEVRAGGSDSLLAVAQFPGRIAEQLEPGMPARVTVKRSGESSRVWNAEVSRVLSIPQTGHLAQNNLDSGQAVEIELVTEAIDDLPVPYGTAVEVQILLGRQSPAVLLGLARS